MAVVTLSNPLNTTSALRLGMVAREYLIGETVAVDRGAALSLIEAGLTTIDPTDYPAVAAALGDPAPTTDMSAGSLTAEQVRDIAAAMLQGGSGVTVTADDAADQVVIELSGTVGGLASETIRDTVAAMLVAGPGVSLVEDDAANTLTLTATGGGTGGGSSGSATGTYDTSVYGTAVFG